VQKLQQNNNATILHVGKGVQGCSPWSATPFGGERDSHSIFLKKFKNALIKEFCITIPVVKKGSHVWFKKWKGIRIKKW
jgi:hypothetical protein